MNNKLLNRFWAFGVITSALLLGSCKKDSKSSTADTGNAIFITPISNTIILDVKKLVFSTVPSAFDVSVSLRLPATDSVTASLEIDNQLVEAYNKRNGSNYLIMPVGSYSLVDAELGISKGQEASKKTQLLVHTSQLENDKSYLLPLKIASVSSSAVVNDPVISSKYFVINVPTPIIGNLSDNKSSKLSNGWEPQRGNDGNTNGEWGGRSVCETGAGSEEFWEVDLGGVSPRIDTIRIWNRTDCCDTRTSKFYVFISDVPFVGNSVASSTSQPGVYKYYQDEKSGRPTEIYPKVSGRYIRLQNTTTESLTLAELTAIGIIP